MLLSLPSLISFHRVTIAPNTGDDAEVPLSLVTSPSVWSQDKTDRIGQDKRRQDKTG